MLIDRYGVVFRDLLAREAGAPPWHRLAPVYRRLEARGELRGGRFVAGVAGEQYAGESAVEALRRVRDKDGALEWVVISAADPLNLLGILTAGTKVPPQRAARLALRDGRLAATFADGQVALHQTMPPALAREIAAALRTPAGFRDGEDPPGSGTAVPEPASAAAPGADDEIAALPGSGPLPS